MNSTITFTSTSGRINRLILCLLTAIIAFGSHAQMPVRGDTLSLTPQLPDSLTVAYHAKKHFWRAGAEVIGLDLFVWGFDRLNNRDYSKISFKSIKHNFQKGFRWDNDDLVTNTFFHPYNGSLYYTCARANGYSYYASGLFALGGSAIWELCMENEYPSTSDVIATPVGGMAIGEALYRTSDLLTDDTSWGWQRAWREIAGTIISPMRGFNRIITGQAWQRSALPGRQFGIPPFSLRVGMGVRTTMSINDYYRQWGGVLCLQAEYGDRFAEKTVHPFDYFTAELELQAADHAPVLKNLQIQGRLWGKNVNDSERTPVNIGIYQEFDFCDADTIPDYNNLPFKYSVPASVSVTAMTKHTFNNGTRIDASLGAGAIGLGCAVSDHYQSENRNYNYGSGFSAKAAIAITGKNNLFSIGLKSQFYQMYSWEGYKKTINPRLYTYRVLSVQGDNSRSSIVTTDLRADVKVWRQLYATIAVTQRFRASNYRDYGLKHASEFDTRFMLTYWL